MRSRPLATLLAVISGILILFGRVNHDLWWCNWIAIAGFAVLLVAGALCPPGQEMIEPSW